MSEPADGIALPVRETAQHVARIRLPQFGIDAEGTTVASAAGVTSAFRRGVVLLLRTIMSAIGAEPDMRPCHAPVAGEAFDPMYGPAVRCKSASFACWRGWSTTGPSH